MDTSPDHASRGAEGPPSVATRDPILLTTLRLFTFAGQSHLTNASGFFFERGTDLFLVTSRHVLLDADAGHIPDRISIELHIDPQNLARSTDFSMPLYRDGFPLWRVAVDGGGEVDVAVIPIERNVLPKPILYRSFTGENIAGDQDHLEIGSGLMVVGYPLGFHDTLHRVPVVRHAALASSFGLRFQGKGYFLTDARTHRGTSGAPVVMPVDHRNVSRRAGLKGLPWLLLGVHSSRLDLGSRDQDLDEALGLNCTWYADVLLVLTAP